jgi:hypothetical protein
LNLSMAASVGVRALPNAPKPSGRGITRYQRFEYQLVPRKGLEPSRFAPLVPETSASTNSATWASAAS